MTRILKFLVGMKAIKGGLMLLLKKKVLIQENFQGMGKTYFEKVYWVTVS